MEQHANARASEYQQLLKAVNARDIDKKVSEFKLTTPFLQYAMLAEAKSAKEKRSETGFLAETDPDDMWNQAELPLEKISGCMPYVSRFSRPEDNQLVESEFLSSVSYPEVSICDYLYIDTEFIDTKSKISGAQLEVLLNSAYCHSIMFDGTKGSTRQGFILADGTGTGKTRACFLIILENWFHQYRLQPSLKHDETQVNAVWISASHDLVDVVRNEAREVLSTASFKNPFWDKENNCIREYPIYPLRDFKHTDVIKMSGGILYCTYAQLAGVYGRKRLSQIIQFITMNRKYKENECSPVIIIDEAHKCNNAGGKSSNGSQSFQAIMELQGRIPQAKVVYVSASPASQDPSKLEAFERIGLWGQGTPFENFNSFLKLFKNRDNRTNTLELLAIDLKRTGKLMCRMMPPPDPSNCLEYVAVLTDDQVRLYDQACVTFNKIRDIVEAKDNIDQDIFRFFVTLITSFKATNILPWIRKNVEEGKSLVIGLQKTGASSLNEDIINQNLQINSGGCRNILDKWLEKANIKDEYSEYLKELPKHAVDILTTEIDNVAEITGRGRILDCCSLETTNRQIEEANTQAISDFQNGVKNVLVLSGARNEGISLHATALNPRQRVHVCLEISEDATSQFQQFGRIDRNGQVSKPLYYMIKTDLPSEIRFISSLNRKLAEMGAMVRGDRNLGGPFSHSTIDWLGKDSTTALGTLLKLPMWEDLKKDSGERQSIEALQRSDKPRVFLNKLFNIKVQTQKHIFERFTQVLKKRIAMSHFYGNGNNDEIEGESINVTSEKKVLFEKDNLVLYHHGFVVDIGCSWQTCNKHEGTFWIHKLKQYVIKVIGTGEVKRIVSPLSYPTRSAKYITDKKLRQLYVTFEKPEQIQNVWTTQYEQNPKRFMNINILSGTPLQLQHIISMHCTIVKNIKIRTGVDKKILVGIQISEGSLEDIEKKLQTYKFHTDSSVSYYDRTFGERNKVIQEKVEKTKRKRHDRLKTQQKKPKKSNFESFLSEYFPSVFFDHTPFGTNVYGKTSTSLEELRKAYIRDTSLPLEKIPCSIDSTVTDKSEITRKEHVLRISLSEPEVNKRKECEWHVKSKVLVINFNQGYRPRNLTLHLLPSEESTTSIESIIDLLLLKRVRFVSVRSVVSDKSKQKVESDSNDGDVGDEDNHKDNNNEESEYEDNSDSSSDEELVFASE